MVCKVCSLRGWATSVSNRIILVTVRACTDDVIEGSPGREENRRSSTVPVPAAIGRGEERSCSSRLCSLPCVAETSETNAPRTMRRRARPRPPTHSQNTKCVPSSRVEGISCMSDTIYPPISSGRRLKDCPYIAGCSSSTAFVVLALQSRHVPLRSKYRAGRTD
jgi:hypothetical protein